ncbi:MAG: WS/DGAT/MGAT family O-acyltransferase [Acidimicrobiia bacterium]
MERLGSLDAMFIAIEDPVNHMHIGSIGIFEGPSPGFDAVRLVVRSKLPLVPRYHQRVREAPFSVGRPLWIDDVHFDLRYHLRHSALPPDEPRALEHLVERVMSQALDRARPLWEMWVVEGLPDDRWALVSKVHHCMVDGIAGTDLLAVMMDLEPDAPTVTLPPWTYSPEPTRAQLAWDTLTMSAAAVTGAARGLLDASLHPRQAVGAFRDFAAGAAALVAPKHRAAGTLTGPIGPHRRWTRASASIDDVRTIRGAFGGTLNDVVLAAITRGFRALLLDRGEPVAGRSVSSLVPVSMRTADARGVFDNRVAAFHALLPVGIEDPVDTLAAVRAHLDELKRSHEVDASEVVLSAGDIVPPVLAAALARVVVHAQDTFQTVTTNVPGPQFPLYLAGRRMIEAYPYVPVAGHIQMDVAIWSYCGTLYFGVTGDLDGAPDIEVLAHGIEAGFAELTKAAADAS